MDLNKQLYRSDTNKILFGVCGGLGEYFNIDPTIIRLLWVVFSCSGTGLIVYLIAALIMPLRPDGRYKINRSPLYRLLKNGYTPNCKMIMREECTHFLWQRKRKRNHWILKI